MELQLPEFISHLVQEWWEVNARLEMVIWDFGLYPIMTANVSDIPAPYASCPQDGAGHRPLPQLLLWAHGSCSSMLLKARGWGKLPSSYPEMTVFLEQGVVASWFVSLWLTVLLWAQHSCLSYGLYKSRKWIWSITKLNSLVELNCQWPTTFSLAEFI